MIIESKTPFYRSIVAKLFVATALCMLLAVGGISWQNHRLFRSMVEEQRKDELFVQTRESSNTVVSTIENWAGQLAVMMHGLGQSAAPREISLVNGMVQSNKEFIAVHLIEDRPNSSPTTKAFSVVADHTTEPRFENYGIDTIKQRIANYDRRWIKKLVKANPKAGFHLANSSRATKLPTISLAVPFVMEGAKKRRYWAVLTAWQTRIAAALPHGDLVSSRLIDTKGRVIVSQSVEEVLKLVTFADHPLAIESEKASVNVGFRKFVSPGGEDSLGAFFRLDDLGLTVLIEQRAEQLFLSTDRIVKQTALWSWMFVLISILLSWLVARGMTKSIRAVAMATGQIATGDFNIHIASRSQDEIGGLGHSINLMAKRLSELMIHNMAKQRMEQELATAQIVQQTFLASRTTTSNSLRVAGESRSASECGGDWWGHFKLNDGYELVCIADATGHGVSAALITAMLHSSMFTIVSGLQSQKGSTVQPEHVLSWLNSLFYTVGQGEFTMTCLVAVIDSKSGTVRVANAGHNRPFLISSQGERRNKERDIAIIKVAGNILGLDEISLFRPKTVQLTAGDKLVFYTDGLTECKSQDGQVLGHRALRKFLKKMDRVSPAELRETLLSTAEKHANGVTFDDDITVVVLEYGHVSEQEDDEYQFAM